MNLLISFIPIIVMIVMIVGFKVRGDITGTVGWILTIAVAVFFFNTDFVFSLLASLKGLLASMAITGMGFFALLQITFMQETGALQRVVVWIKTFSHGDKPCQIMVINVILGSMLVCVGATPQSSCRRSCSPWATRPSSPLHCLASATIRFARLPCWARPSSRLRTS